MKKTIFAIAAMTFLSVGTSFAQRTSKVVIQKHTIQVAQPAVHYPDLYSAERLDRIVNLSRKQEIQIRSIEKKYDNLQSKGRNVGGKFERLENQKQKEMIAVLSPKQYDRLQAFERNQRNSRVAYHR
ncbi:hypothetical protein [Dyadobacter tibetensis]|uniref:hypothetical protein n=1 Tax=Dyadobacter tibetensis TaxID=1211851 RepID=UPI000471FC84|nr:hypothetical protein [Dyadobacter tibetensis]